MEVGQHGLVLDLVQDHVELVHIKGFVFATALHKQIVVHIAMEKTTIESPVHFLHVLVI